VLTMVVSSVCMKKPKATIHSCQRIPVIFQPAAVLAALAYPNHLLVSAHRDSLAGRLPAT
ncbi:hypothetical protein ACNSPB_02575, partial [Yersinia enterocolitica]